jgi:PncC family amidohydrolase
LETQIRELLLRLGLHLATAESCTGGLVGHRITNVPGSSEVYLGGIVSYSNEAKLSLLGVSRATLERHGAVSEQTVLEMARGAREALGAEIGLSVSGIAGPGGGSPEKPVGTVWIGLSAPGYETARRYLFHGDRQEIKQQSAEAGLQLLLDYLENKWNPSR